MSQIPGLPIKVAKAANQSVNNFVPSYSTFFGTFCMFRLFGYVPLEFRLRALWICPSMFCFVYVLFGYVPSLFYIAMFRLRSLWLYSVYDLYGYFFVYVLYDYVLSTFCGFVPSTFYLRISVYSVYIPWSVFEGISMIERRGAVQGEDGLVMHWGYVEKKVILLNLVQFSLVQYSVLSKVVRMASVSRRRRRNWL